MKSEERGHERAPPDTIGHAHEEQEEQRRVDGVQSQAGGMVAGRRAPKQAPVDPVGEQRQRVPVPGDRRRERPGNELAREPALHVRVLRDVHRVVVVDEVEAEDWPEDDRRRQRQQSGDEPADGCASGHGHPIVRRRPMGAKLRQLS